MRNQYKGYFLKEYGSWSVLIIAYLTGLIASRGFTWRAIPVFLALCVLINSKQALSKWTRVKGDRVSLVVFSGHLVAATVILIAVFGRDISFLLPLLIFPAIYLLLSRFAGEHFILTEVFGFVLISLAAVLAKFTVTGGMDVRLFVAVAFYFTAGVFKIKSLLSKKTLYRVLTFLYVLVTVFAYRGFHISLLILLPLVDNLVAAALLYNVKLKTTGWIEVAKSVLFLVLISIYY